VATPAAAPLKSAYSLGVDDLVLDLLARQVRWQKERAHLTWEEEVRQAEAVRQDVLKWRASRSRSEVAPKPDPAGPERQSRGGGGSTTS
jgi:hypothetical protein